MVNVWSPECGGHTIFGEVNMCPRGSDISGVIASKPFARTFKADKTGLVYTSSICYGKCFGAPTAVAILFLGR